LILIQLKEIYCGNYEKEKEKKLMKRKEDKDKDGRIIRMKNQRENH